MRYAIAAGLLVATVVGFYYHVENDVVGMESLNWSVPVLLFAVVVGAAYVHRRSD